MIVFSNRIFNKYLYTIKTRDTSWKYFESNFSNETISFINILLDLHYTVSISIPVKIQAIAVRTSLEKFLKEDFAKEGRRIELKVDSRANRFTVVQL